MNTRTFRITTGLIVLLLTITISSGRAQEKTKGLHPIWIVQHLDEEPRGYLYQVEEDGVVISHSGSPEDYLYRANQQSYLYIKTSDIQTIKIRKSGKIGRGIMIGAAGGFLVGLTIGLLQGDVPANPNPSQPCGLIGWCFDTPTRSGLDKGLSTGAGLGLLGGITGAIIGSIKFKVPINGNRDLFQMNRPKLQQYAYTR